MPTSQDDCKDDMTTMCGERAVRCKYKNPGDRSLEFPQKLPEDRVQWQNRLTNWKKSFQF